MIQSSHSKLGAEDALHLPQAPGRVKIETRFGTMTFDREQALRFPKGIPGFASHRLFGLALLPSITPWNLMVLQSLEPSDVSLVVTPYTPALGPIEEIDLETARQMLGIPETDCAVLLIVTFRRSAGGLEMSVNQQAPIFIDTRSQRGWQFVLGNENYEVRRRVGA